VSQIAFDLDGVLIPDFDQLPMIGGLDEFYHMSTYVRPIFAPQGDFSIITARPVEYKNITMQWCEKYLYPLPKEIHHERSSETGGAYKAGVLNKNKEIRIYVESDPDIVAYLKKNVTTGCEIVHFAYFLQKELMRV
jgi:hypothetical protein